MPIDPPYNRPDDNNTYTPNPDRRNTKVYQNIQSEQDPIPGRRIDLDIDYLIDVVNQLKKDMNGLTLGEIPGANVPENADKLLQTDGDEDSPTLSWTKINTENVEQYGLNLDRLRGTTPGGGVITFDSAGHPVQSAPGTAGYVLTSNGSEQPATFKHPKGINAEAGSGILAPVNETGDYNVSVNINGLAAETAIVRNSDSVMFHDASANALRKALVQDINTSMANRQVFTANGTFTVPAGVTRVFVECYGGGGGGGGSGLSQAGGSGGGGGYCEAFKTVSPLSPNNTYTVNVGTGGAAGTSSINGAAGGNTTFTGPNANLSAGGGGGGQSNSLVGGTGGIASGGDININGSVGEKVGGGGGGSCSGRYGGKGGAATGPASGTGNPGQNYGGGGGAGGTANGTSGGGGAPGLVVVWW